MPKLVLARTASKSLTELDHLLAEAILDALSALERDPDIGYRLKGRLTGLWSYRVGAYRIIYEQRDRHTLRVLAIRHRHQAYGADPR